MMSWQAKRLRSKVSETKEVMSEQEFKMRVVEDLATLKAEVKSLLKNNPVCEKESIRSDIKINRRLIMLLLVTYIPMLIAFIGAVTKK